MLVHQRVSWFSSTTNVTEKIWENLNWRLKNQLLLEESFRATLKGGRSLVKSTKRPSADLHNSHHVTQFIEPPTTHQSPRLTGFGWLTFREPQTTLACSLPCEISIFSNGATSISDSMKIFQSSMTPRFGWTHPRLWIISCRDVTSKRSRRTEKKKKHELEDVTLATLSGNNHCASFFAGKFCSHLTQPPCEVHSLMVEYGGMITPHCAGDDRPSTIRNPHGLRAELLPPPSPHPPGRIHWDGHCFKNLFEEKMLEKVTTWTVFYRSFLYFLWVGRHDRFMTGSWPIHDLQNRSYFKRRSEANWSFERAGLNKLFGRGALCFQLGLSQQEPVDLRPRGQGRKLVKGQGANGCVWKCWLNPEKPNG